MKHLFTLAVILITALTMNAQEIITCAQAKSVMPGTADSETTQEYVVVGYVTKIERNPSPSHVDSKIMQQWFYLDDQKGGALTVECYWCDLPDMYKEGLNIGDKVAVKGKITNYNGKPEIKNGVVTMLERAIVSFETYEVSVCEAVEAGLALENGEVTNDIYRVSGRIRGVDQLSNFGQHTFDMTCNDSTFFKAYLCAAGRGVRLGKGDSVVVVGKLTNYRGTVEISNGRIELVEKSGEMEITYVVSVAQAIEIALALPNNMTSEDRYAITGYVSSIKEAFNEEHGNMSFYMTDNMDVQTTDFEVYRVRVAEDQKEYVKEGAKVIVTAVLKHYHLDASGDRPAKDVAETLEGGTLVVFPEEGVTNTSADAQAIKRIENGQVIILRNGVRYNTLGAVLR